MHHALTRIRGAGIVSQYIVEHGVTCSDVVFTVLASNAQDETFDRLAMMIGIIEVGDQILVAATNANHLVETRQIHVPQRCHPIDKGASLFLVVCDEPLRMLDFCKFISFNIYLRFDGDAEAVEDGLLHLFIKSTNL